MKNLREPSTSAKNNKSRSNRKSNGQSAKKKKDDAKSTNSFVPQPVLLKSKSYHQKQPDLQVLQSKMEKLNHDESSVDLSELSEINEKIEFMQTKLTRNKSALPPAASLSKRTVVVGTNFKLQDPPKGNRTARDNKQIQQQNSSTKNGQKKSSSRQEQSSRQKQVE